MPKPDEVARRHAGDALTWRRFACPCHLSSRRSRLGSAVGFVRLHKFRASAAHDAGFLGLQKRDCSNDRISREYISPDLRTLAALILLYRTVVQMQKIAPIPRTRVGYTA